MNKLKSVINYVTATPWCDLGTGLAMVCLGNIELEMNHPFLGIILLIYAPVVFFAAKRK